MVLDLKPFPIRPLLILASSIVAAERPTLAPPYQPESWAMTDRLASAARLSRASTPASTRTRLLAYLNISFPGIFAFDRGLMVGEAANRTLLSVERCRDVAQQNPDTIVGIKVRLGGAVSGDVGLDALDCALRAAEPLGLPVQDGQLFTLDTATVSVLAYDRGSPVVARWNS